MDLLQWWNLIFLLPALAALLYLLFTALGALPGEGHDLHAEGHVDGSHDLGHHADLDHAVDHDLAHGNHDPFHGALNLIGIGRVPLSLVLMSFLFLWGFFGWIGNQAFATLLPSPALFIWPSLLLALAGAMVGTGFLARGLGKLMPAAESYGAQERELVGRLADVRYPLTESAGSVQVHDRFGSLFEVPARVLPGEAAIPAGARVVLWRFDVQRGAYLAAQDEAFNDIAATGSISGRAIGR